MAGVALWRSCESAVEKRRAAVERRPVTVEKWQAGGGKPCGNPVGNELQAVDDLWTTCGRPVDDDR
jgi:hypothetical protein